MACNQREILQHLPRAHQALCKTCLACNKKNQPPKASKGSLKPIRSAYFRDRFQVDLIDMRKLRKRDPFGVLMRWILTLKDHATGLVYLTALPRKRADGVAYKLQEIFGVLGFPRIFHTDNGKEFTAKAVLEFLRILNPNILAVSGRTQQPQHEQVCKEESTCPPIRATVIWQQSKLDYCLGCYFCLYQLCRGPRAEFNESIRGSVWSEDGSHGHVHEG